MVQTSEEILNIAYSPDGNLLLISDKVMLLSCDCPIFLCSRRLGDQREARVSLRGTSSSRTNEMEPSMSTGPGHSLTLVGAERDAAVDRPAEDQFLVRRRPVPGEDRIRHHLLGKRPLVLTLSPDLPGVVEWGSRGTVVCYL